MTPGCARRADVAADCTLAPMRVLMAPDKFRGTLSAAAAATAMAAGWRRARPDDEVVRVPMADGGEGTLDILVDALSGERHRARVSGPLGDPVDAEYGTFDGAAGPAAIVEMARASGLELIGESRRDPLRTSTRGTGELIRAALDQGPAEIIVGVGGSGTNDGGAGMAQALGARLVGAAGAEIAPGGASLRDLAHIDLSGLDPRVRGTRFVVASDVDSPLTGPLGASAVYGPQKGATPEAVALLDGALGHLAAVIHRDLGLDVSSLPGGGAAGGLGAGLVAFLGAHVRPGTEVVVDAVGLRERLLRSDLVVTGEGKLDDQSLRGKVVAGVLEAARGASVPAWVVCGRAEITLDDVSVFDLVGRFGEDRAMTQTRAALEELMAEVAATSADRSHGR